MNNSKLNVTISNKFIAVLASIGFLLFGFRISAQNPTIGLLKSSTEIEDSYTLFTPEKNQAVMGCQMEIL